MQQTYTDDDQCRQILRKFMALAFVEIADIYQAFELVFTELLAYNNSENHQKFVEHLENTWIGRPYRRACFKAEMWNARATIEINDIGHNFESCHLALQKSLGCHHSIYKLMEQLIKENIRVNTISMKLVNGDEVPSTSYSDHRHNSNAKLINLIEKYSKPGYDISTFLTDCSPYVAHLE